jgi:hypothetical protein
VTLNPGNQSTNQEMTIQESILQKSRMLRDADKELAFKRELAVREYTYGSGTMATIMAIHDEQTQVWHDLLSLHGMTVAEWRLTPESERRRLWGDRR